MFALGVVDLLLAALKMIPFAEKPRGAITLAALSFTTEIPILIVTMLDFSGMDAGTRGGKSFPMTLDLGAGIPGGAELKIKGMNSN